MKDIIKKYKEIWKNFKELSLGQKIIYIIKTLILILIIMFVIYMFIHFFKGPIL